MSELNSYALIGIDPKTRKVDIISILSAEYISDMKELGYIVLVVDKVKARQIWTDAIDDVLTLDVWA